MTSLAAFEVTGAADPGRYRLSAIVDFVAAALLAILAFPFPILRAVLPLPVFVASILLSVVVAHFLYLTATVMLWGRTPAMYLFDMGLSSGRASVLRAGRWAFGATLDFWPIVLSPRSREPRGRLAARMSGVELGSTADAKPAASQQPDNPGRGGE